MPRNIPAAPDYSAPGSGAERRVWQALQALPDDATVISQYRVLDDRGVLREADFVVLVPGVGVGVVEVKGGLVWAIDGEWMSRDGRGVDHPIKDPMWQAQKAGFTIRSFVTGQGVRWPSWVPVVVLPDTTLPRSFAPGDSDRKDWIDGLDDLAERLSAAIDTGEEPDSEELVAVLETRLPKPSARQAAALATKRADLITRDQYAILRAVRTNDRILVTGGPGTGKTWLALEHARQETLRGARVAVLSYNRGLATYLQRYALGWPEDQRPALIGTLHEVAVQWTGTQVPEDADPEFWDALPAQLAAAAADVADRFDLVIVDEAQDFREDWWPAVLSLLNDPEGGPLVAFGDEDQELYGRGVLGLPALEVTLEENIRNTVQIAEVLEKLTGQHQECRGARGPAPVFIDCAEGEVLDRADDVVVALLQDDQYRPGDIAVLTTHRRHPEHSRRLAEMGPLGFADSLIATDEVAYCTVKGFKGLERPAVVLAVNGFHDVAERENLLRVGVSRACHQLVVVGMGAF
jgi:hypothetical protein